MSRAWRLGAGFSVVLLLPLLALIASGYAYVVHRDSGDIEDMLQLRVQATAAVLNAECQRLDVLSALLASSTGTGTRSETRAALQRALDRGADYASVTDASNTSVQLGTRPPGGDQALRPCAQDPVGPVLAAITMPDGGVEAGSTPVRAVVAEQLTADLLDRAALEPANDVEVILAVDSRPLAATTPLTGATGTRASAEAAAAVRDVGDPVPLDGRLVLGTPLRPGSSALVVVAMNAPSRSGPLLAATALTLGALALAGALGWAAALAVSRSTKALVEAARGRRREEVRDELERLGEALSATHDLSALLGVVLESAIAAVQADGGVAYAVEPGGAYELVSAQGVDDLPGEPAHRLQPGEGVLGLVVQRGAATRGRAGSESDPDDARQWLLAVPLWGGQGVTGLLALLRNPAGASFTAEDEEEIRSLAQHAGIAVDNVLLHRETQRLAITDPLTGLWNFRYLSLSLAREIERASRFGRPLALLMLDIDHFKSVNDTYGHGRGDAVLREFVVRVGHQVREVDVLARYGGEEFVLALPETPIEGAVGLAERIREAVAHPSFGVGGAEPKVSVTVSIGVAAFPDHGSSPATLLEAADSALYQAKRSGRNRTVVARGGVRTAPEVGLGRGGVGADG